MPQIAESTGPKYLAIAGALAVDIESGRLKVGDRLPPQRQLARELGVDLTTITRAFNEAHRLGLIEASAGRGSFVRGRPTFARGNTPAAPPMIDLSMNMPPQPAGAKLRERIRDGVAEVLSGPHGLMHLNYQESAGARPDRLAASRWLAARLGPVSIDRLVVAGGAQTALHAVVQILVRPGQTLCVPDVTYPGLKAIAEQLHVRLAPVAMDGEGMLADALAVTCERESPRGIYCVPTIHNPTTATMTESRREAIIRVARRHGIAIIEDDAYGALPRHAPAPIAALAPDLTWHIATLSKCATPALRTAFVATPALADALNLAARIRAASLMAPPLMTALATRWIEDGTLDAITAAIREESAARQAIARRILRGMDLQAHPEGHHLWLTLPDRWRQGDLNRQARQSGLALVPSEAFAVGAAPDAIRVSLGAAENRVELERGLGLLAAVLSQGAGTVSSVV
ncbi:aminotransferase-like domain-containing protein [Microvirga pudoricolor]|uniref:aminotransferase-like domain-containing protein n=1 Tax=Microvirga pudoricolor TaxID=2778729 RepID=UPI001950415F|nr:PLP-dependent aminotransferase family protein [Microvirga pudoricolor]MBM6594220.1 PLP-dependent aminotransferase family protein [Microvirga pudoricolor]